MLDVLRKRKRSWVVIFFLAIIVVVFIAFYGGNKFREPGTEKVAEINGEAISQRDFAVQYQRTLDIYRNMMKRELTPETLKTMKIKNTVLEDMIQRRLVLQETRRLGLAVSDDELMNAISPVPGFSLDGSVMKNSQSPG